jgi:4-amino-4-deoxy-L-arabinose transferase-like glycosyltransferase
VNTASTTRRHLIILTAICALAYALGLTSHGVAAWHEGQRLLVARQMLDSGEWIVPRINGHPYLAKPPAFYWAQMVIAGVRGASVALLDTRLAVAIFGWLGVIATYFAARDMLQPPREMAPDRARAWTATAAFWAAAMLATGIDYARSARIGELDMLLVAPVVTAVWMVFRAWHAHLGVVADGSVGPPRMRWGACILAAMAASVAALTKGPPAQVIIAIAAYGGMLLHAARADAPLRVTAAIPLLSRGRGEPAEVPRVPAWATLAGAALGVAVALFFSIAQIEESRDAIGAVVGAAMAGLVGGAIAGLVQPRRAAAAFAALSRTHPFLVLGVPLLVLWAWIRTVNAGIDPGLLDAWAGEEVGDNLRPFRPASPLSILEAASFGVGLGSAAFFATIAWMLWRRPRFQPGWWILIAWSVGGLIAFSLFGKGLARYVLPVWPAMAMVGGIGVAETLRLGGERTRRRTRGVLVIGVALLTVAHAAWYAWGRVQWFSHRSPRDFVQGLRAPELRVSPRRIATFELYDPGIDYYLDEMTAPEPGRNARTQPVGDIRTRFNLTGVEPWTLERLRGAVRRRGPWTVIVRERQGNRAEQRPAIERLALAGFTVTVLPVRGEYWQDGGDTRLLAVRVDLPE